MSKEFKSYEIVGSISVVCKDSDESSALIYPTDTVVLSEYKAINIYKDLVWEFQGIFNNLIIQGKISFSGSVILYGRDSNDERVAIMRKQTFIA